MAKAETKTEDQTALTTVAGAGVPSFLGDRAKQDAGKGTSQAEADNMVPLLYVLQAQSPQCNKRGPDYVEGAEAGAIWLRNSGLPAISGETGVLFQPCYFDKDYVEWVPRDNGGGMVARHRSMPAEAVETPDPQNPKRTSWVMPNGNEIKETRYHIGIVYLEDGRNFPYVIPLSGSGHSVSRQWMFLMNSKQLPGVDGPAPSWSARYTLRTKFRSNASGDWYVLDVTDAGWVNTLEDYERGAALHAAFAAGEKTYEAPADDPSAAATGDLSTQAM